jgi:hypothetical protein
MFKDSTQFNGGAVFPAATNTKLHVAFSGVPAALNISNCEAVMTDSLGVLSSGNPILSSTSVAAAAPVLTVSFSQPVNLNTPDIVWITCNVGAGTAALPLNSTPVTAQVNLGPVGAAVSASGMPLTDPATGQIPRYQEFLQPAMPLTVIEFPFALPITGRRGQITSQ